MRSLRSFSVLALSLALGLGVASPALAVRPTPHELINQALQPIRDQLVQLNATEAERRDVADILARSEALAAELIEAQHAGNTERAQSVARMIQWLGKLTRGRIEAIRAEFQANESERLALEAEARRVQARASLERAAERRLEIERGQSAGAESTAPSLEFRSSGSRR